MNGQMIEGLLPDPTGLHVLAPDGSLAVYDAQGRLQSDDELTAGLQAHNRRLLAAARDGRAERVRLALVFNASRPRAWGRTLMFLEEAVVRRLYPSAGPDQPLTAFQRRHRELSLYRGLELLLEYRDKQAPELPIFCPVLFDAGCDRGSYPSAHDLQDAAAPVIEVLDLFFGLPQGQRSELRPFAERLHAGLIRKERRAEARFSLIERGEHAREEASADDAYLVDARAERQVSLSAADLAVLESLHAQQRVAQIERWLEVPLRPVQPADLRRFLHFRDVHAPCLERLAAHSPVYTAPAGAPLIERASIDAWNLYLLEGTVMLSPQDGQSFMVEAGTPTAASPIAFLKPRKYAVRALSKVSFLWLHDRLLRAVFGAPRVAVQSSAGM